MAFDNFTPAVVMAIGLSSAALGVFVRPRLALRLVALAYHAVGRWPRLFCGS
jgi:hypothetical protein